MADFSTIKTKRNSIDNAYRLLDNIRATYANAKQAQTLLNLYTANTDPTFNAAINALFTSAHRTELAAMLAQINALVADWETNHASAITP
jgi:hypothetical protein